MVCADEAVAFDRIAAELASADTVLKFVCLLMSYHKFFENYNCFHTFLTLKV